MLKAKRIFTAGDWAAASEIDKIYIHMIDPDRFHLTETLAERFKNLRIVWSIYCERHSSAIRIKEIAEQLSVSEPTANRLIKDAMYIFGDLIAVDTKAELEIGYQRYMAMLDMSMEKKDYEQAAKIQANATKLLDSLRLLEKPAKKQYTTIVFTDNPAALRPRNEDAEEADYSEILPNASLLEPETVAIPAHH